jgi:predicted nucleic acid-binding protein
MILFDTNILIEIYRNNPVIVTLTDKIGHENIVISDVTRSKMAVNFVEKYCLSHKLDIEDALIAATAIYHNIELLTLNLKDFQFLPDIKIYELI